MGKMSWHTFQTVVDKIMTDTEPELVNFSGMGEPTINPLLPDFVDYLSSRGVKVQLTTNAFTLSPDLIVRLLEAGLDSIFVSFNGHTDTLYEKTMGGLSLDRTTDNIRSLFALANKEVHVLANVSVTKLNQDYLPNIRECLSNLGIRDIVFAQCHNRGGYFRDSSICATPIFLFDEGRCDIFKDTLFIAWNGEVLSCCHDLEGKGLLGDLNDEDFREIISRKRKISQKGVHFPMCEDCNDLYRCMDDHTLDDSPLSQWIYALYAGKDERTARFRNSIAVRDNRIHELEQLVSSYESGWCIRTINWFKGILGL
jgi:radical SAM protein with 4Fe4S-binding SPASM domain